MNKKEKILEIISIVKEIPVSSVIERRIEVISRGSQSFALCPFHADTHLGSFVITDSKGIWKCFSCPEGFAGDGPKFISLYDKISYYEAILKIALEFDVISTNEYVSLKKGAKKSEFNNLNYEIKKEVIEETEMADEDTLHFVYSLFSKGTQLTGQKSPLSDEHLNYLKGRGLSEDKIKENKYFTIPTRFAMRKILNTLSQRGMDKEILIGVPGFYRMKKDNKITFATSKGIGIPIYNENRKIVGIQIRRDKIEEGQSRYTWFSSAFATSSDKYSDGTAQTSPINTVLPDEIKSNTLFITEGHFKANVLAQKYKSAALSVQGIGNWKNIDRIIDVVNKNQYKGNLKNIYIAFDADMDGNLNVANQAIKMARILSKKANVFFILWDKQYGKGIDDLLENEDGESKVKKLTSEKFQIYYNDYLMKLMKRMDVLHSSEIQRKMIEEFGREQTKELLAKSFVKLVLSKN